MTDQWETSVGNLMPWVPYESFDTDAARSSVLVGANFLKKMLMDEGYTEQDALERIASLRRLTEGDTPVDDGLVLIRQMKEMSSGSR